MADKNTIQSNEWVCKKRIDFIEKLFFKYFCFETEIIEKVVAKKNKVAKIPPHIADYR